MLKVEDIEKAIALALLSEAIGRDVYRKLQRMAGKEEAELFGELAEVKENAYNRLLRLYNELME
ncbi:hypothetical protein [Thermococcus sp.]|nr:hypothetical protein [Thermococcus sp.]